MRKLITLTALMFFVSSVQAVELHSRTTPLGQVLTDEHGMTLYTFDKDKNGTSACYDDCATRWPPVYVNANVKLTPPFSSTARRDGKLQLRWNNQPLYLWFKDKAPGETSGDMVNKVWHVVLINP
ncbi:MAG: hypothetical protein RSD49_01145 [Hafnia sp.]